MKPSQASILLCAIFLFAGVPGVRAQEGPVEGGHELEFWTGGGYGVKGVEQHTGVWMAGVRYGWILTRPHGPGFLRGRFEYAVDVVPGLAVFQSANTTHGVAVDPIGLKWDFDSHKSVVPYMELGGGVLFTNTQVPPGSSRVNFSPEAGIGLHFLAGKLNWSADVRYIHFSNGGLYPLNPGVNTVQLRIGVGWFTHAHN